MKRILYVLVCLDCLLLLIGIQYSYLHYNDNVGGVAGLESTLSSPLHPLYWDETRHQLPDTTRSKRPIDAKLSKISLYHSPHNTVWRNSKVSEPPTEMNPATFLSMFTFIKSFHWTCSTKIRSHHNIIFEYVNEKFELHRLQKTKKDWATSR